MTQKDLDRLKELEAKPPHQLDAEVSKWRRR